MNKIPALYLWKSGSNNENNYKSIIAMPAIKFVQISEIAQKVTLGEAEISTQRWRGRG